MAEPRHLDNAPIIEAVVELRFPESIDWPEPPFSGFSESGFTETSAISTRSIEFNSETKEVVQDERQVGWEFLNSQRNKMLRLEDNKVIVSKRAPYTDWEELIEGLHLALPILDEYGAGQKASRLGTRFINRIPVPRGNVTLSEYMINGPVLPKISDRVVEFQFRTMHLDEVNNNILNIMVSGESDPEKGPAIVLDIDAFSRQELEINRKLLDIKLGQLRQLKNDAFFKTVTEKALEGL